MLGAVKMEGHEHPDWSGGGGYYGEAEVGARSAGWEWTDDPSPDEADKRYIIIEN